MNKDKETLLSICNVDVGYRHAMENTVLMQHMNLEVNKGELICLLGPNGCGKSTLLKTLANLQEPLKGDILLKGKPLNTYKRTLSEEISVVLTDKFGVGILTVADVVALGRFPYTNWLGTLQSKDVDIIKRSLEAVNMYEARHRPIGELSDGEQQRVFVAKALAQDTPLIFLDEPTAHLDLPNRISMMHLLKKLVVDYNKSIVLSTHELDLALQVTDRIWLIDRNYNIFEGIPEDLVLSGVFENAFKQDQLHFDRSSGVFRVDHEWSREIQVLGFGESLYWTKRALGRVGILCIEDNHAYCVEVLANNKWIFSSPTITQECGNLEEVLSCL